MAKKTTSKSQKDCYARYKNDNRAMTNKVAKLEKHIALTPNDVQAVAALAKLKGSAYTGRKAPKRNRARLHNGESLNTLSGRLGRPGKEFQQLVHVANVAAVQMNFRSKEERELDLKIKKERFEAKMKAEGKSLKGRGGRGRNVKAKGAKA